MKEKNGRPSVMKSERPSSSIVGSAHGRFIYQRRIRAIVHAIAPLIPSGTILDIGCGNGELASYLMSNRADVKVIGLEVYFRLKAKIPLVTYSGGAFPFAEGIFSSVLIADTLHHIQDQNSVLEECLRVSRGPVIIKDHFYRNRWEHLMLRFLDIGGNAAQGVPSIFNYYSRASWEKALEEVNAQELYRAEQVPGQYPIPFQWLLGRRIQFVSKIIDRTTG